VRLVFYHARLASRPPPLEVSESPPHSVTRDSMRATAVFGAVSYDRPFHSDQELASSSQTGDAHLVSTLCEPRAVALRNSTALPLASPPAQESLPGCAIERSGGTNHTLFNLTGRGANVKRKWIDDGYSWWMATLGVPPVVAEFLQRRVR
jgi:hypothetical protein